MTQTTKPMVRVHNVTTDEVVDREMTNEEFADYEKNLTELQVRKTEMENLAIQRQAILDKLGISAEEVAVLLA